MHPGDQSTNDDPAYDTPTIQTTLFPLPESRPLPIREFLTTDQPRHRLAHQGATALSDAELLAVITAVPCLETAQRLLITAGGLRGLQALSTVELQQLVAGIGVGRAAQLKAAIELGTRVARGDWRERRQVKSPTDIADLLLLEMSHLDQEHLRTVLLDTKNRVQAISTVYIFLILYQMPEATRVAGYTMWQRLGRQVRRGERGITIFAPAPFKKTATDAATGEVTEEIIPRFKTATVFDIAAFSGLLRRA